jgi:hypothetical protein
MILANSPSGLFNESGFNSLIQFHKLLDISVGNFSILSDIWPLLKDFHLIIIFAI